MAISRTLPHGQTTRERRRHRSHVAIGPGLVVGIIAAAGLVVSMFMSWSSGRSHPSSIPAAFLWDRTATGDPSMLVYLIPLAALLAIGSIMRGGAALRLLAGLLAMVVVGVFAYQMHEVADAFRTGFSDVIDAGWYVAAVASVVGFVSGFLPTYLPTTRVDETYEERTVDDGRDDRVVDERR
jgi:hypothetical protein